MKTGQWKTLSQRISMTDFRAALVVATKENSLKFLIETRTLKIFYFNFKNSFSGWNRGGYDNQNTKESPFSPIEDTNAIVIRKWGHMRAKFKVN